MLGKDCHIRSAKIMRTEKMIEIENPMLVDWWWDELEYGIPNKRRMKRERKAYEEAEREDREIERRR